MLKFILKHYCNLFCSTSLDIYSAFLARLGHSRTLLLLYNSPVAQTWKLSISCKTWKPLGHLICTSLSKICPLCISQACAPLVHVECASLRHSWELSSLLLCIRPLPMPIDSTQIVIHTSVIHTKVWMTIWESGWNLWVWLVGVVSRRWVWLVGGIYGYGYHV